MGKLMGIEEVCEYSKQTVVTLIDWKNHYDFPMEKGPDNIWWSTTTKIRKWYKERKINPKTVTSVKLDAYQIQQMRKSGEIKPINRRLKGLYAICEFSGFSDGTVFDWYKTYEGCPIKKAADGTLEADADELQEWMENLGIKIGYKTHVVSSGNSDA